MGLSISKVLLAWCQLVVLCMVVLPVYGQSLRIAVAANAQFVIRPLQEDFTRRTGIDTEIIVGSSGKLTAQILNGAPYDVFLSADMDYPERIYSEGHSQTVVQPYAYGRLIVASTYLRDIHNWKQLLMTNKVQKVALAKPELAPYGLAAREALQHVGLWNQVQHKIVFGESISQVNTYLMSGAVELVFTTEALIKEYKGAHKIHWLRVDEKSYKRIAQGMIICNYAKARIEKAKAFYNYMLSDAAQEILIQYGYNVE